MPSNLHPSRASLDIVGSARRGGITSLTVDVPTPYHHSKSPSRWRTPEFFVYYVFFVVVVPWMAWVPVSLSSTSHRNYNLYRHRLAPGWLFGREVDNSDLQYRSFRSNIPALALLLSVFFLLKYIYTRPIFRTSAPPPNNMHRIPFYTAFSIIMLFALHGTSALKVLLILAVNYALARACKGHKGAIAATWLFNGAVLFLNDKHSGYTFASAHPALGFLDSWQGVYPRWHVSFNITMLRLVSFSVDYHWACTRTGAPDTANFDMSAKQRATTFHPLEAYSFANYLAYALYAPLYIAGPIMTFNDFMCSAWLPDHRAQLARPTTISARKNAHYALRFLGTLLTMELILHFMYVVAIKDTHAWGGDSVAELSMIGFWNLMVVWLKLLLPWRFFRLWALLDGVDPPENMVRCMANNYSTLGFWRSWHRSYNLWIVRYIYVPLGGTKHVAVSSVLVFTFVALWHDLSFKLLAWGWLVSLFILPELLARRLLPLPSLLRGRGTGTLCAAGAVGNALMMVSANMVGFVVGTDGMKHVIHEIVGSWAGLRFLVSACVCIFVGVQLMFEYREEEGRRGIYRRC